MHPNPVFRGGENEAWLAFADARGFAHICAATPAGPMVVHAPVVRSGERTLAFHIARANRLCPHLDGARVIVSVSGVEGYVSPNWYATRTNQVPTWNYVAAEFDGLASALDEDALVAQLDTLAERHEPRVNLADPWARDKMDDAVFRKMLGGIRGFSVAVDAIRATTKLSQHKPADLATTLAGLRASGNDALAAAMAAA